MSFPFSFWQPGFNPEDQCTDGLASYANGSVSSLLGGDGWGGAGKFLVTDYSYDLDCVGSYADGSLALANGGSGWGDDGEFLVTDYSWALDSAG